MTRLAAGLFSGDAWFSSLSIKKWLIASALAACMRASFSATSKSPFWLTASRQFHMIPPKPTTSATLKLAASPAKSGFRWHHLHDRVSRPTRLAAIGSPSRNRSRSAASCQAVS